MSFDAFSANTGTASPSSTAPAAQNTPAPAPSTPAPSSAPAAPEAPLPAAASTPNTPAAPQTGEPKTWEPNYKFKVMDKEHEIDPMFRDIIKDADSEKKVKELFEKSYGLDVVKEAKKQFQEKFRQADTLNQQVLGQISDVREAYQAGDIEGFLKKLNVDEKKVLQYFLDKANYSQLPPEQREVLDARKTAEKRARDAEKQAQTFQTQMQETAAQARVSELQIVLAKPDTMQFNQAFDSLGVTKSDGSPMTFRDAVIEAGLMAHYQSGGKVDLSPEEAVKQVMSRYGAVIAARAAASSAPGQAQGSPPVVPAGSQAAAPSKTLPNLGNRNAGAVGKPKVRSIDELKKLAAGVR